VNGFGDERGGMRYLLALRQHWFLILLVVVTAVAAALIYASTAEERYEAEADVLVTPVAAADETLAGLPLIRESGESRAVLTVARLIESAAVADGVRRRLNTSRSRASLLRSIEVAPQEQSTIVTITGEAEDPGTAARIANAFPRELIEQRTAVFQERLEASIARSEARLNALSPENRALGLGGTTQQRLDAQSALLGAQDPTVQLASPAAVPTSPVWPRRTLSVAVALVAGLLLGAGLAIGIEMASARIKREEDLTIDQRLPILTRVPQMLRRELGAYLTGDEPLPPDVRESYRTLRVSISGLGPNSTTPQSILIVSAMPGDGKTMTAVNLALSMANVGMRVILIDADLRRPMVGTMLRASSPRGGFADMLLDRAIPPEVLVHAPGKPESLRLLLSTPEPFHVDSLVPDAARRVLEQLRPLADVIIIDSPALAEVSDALALADVADSTVVAVRLGRTRRDKLHELRRVLAQRGVQPAGLVVTTRDRPQMYGYYGVESELVAAGREPAPGSPPVAVRSADRR
jgi:Mrp family chromosome partitioning ATPase/capsular polysaccharide biosynthesis protein